MTKKLTRKEAETILNILKGVNQYEWEKLADSVDRYFRRRVHSFISGHGLAAENDERYFSEILDGYKD